jgi:hypothetical protein
MEWLTIKTKGQPLALLSLYNCLAVSNAGCFIESLRKGRDGYSMTICVKPEFDSPTESHAEALEALRNLVYKGS